MKSEPTSNIEDDRGKHTSPDPLKLPIRTAIVAEHLSGLNFRKIAERYDVSVSTVAAVWNAYQRTTEESKETLQQFRERITTKAYSAVDDGLDARQDPYKRAGLGIQVLKGVGEFEQDTAKVQVNNFINAIPSEWRERYIGTGDENENKLRESVPEVGQGSIETSTKAEGEVDGGIEV